MLTLKPPRDPRLNTNISRSEGPPYGDEFTAFGRAKPPSSVHNRAVYRLTLLLGRIEGATECIECSGELYKKLFEFLGICESRQASFVQDRF